METCHKPNCRRPPALTYLGNPLCDYHWLVRCEQEGRPLVLPSSNSARNGERSPNQTSGVPDSDSATSS